MRIQVKHTDQNGCARTDRLRAIIDTSCRTPCDVGIRCSCELGVNTPPAGEVAVESVKGATRLMPLDGW